VFETTVDGIMVTDLQKCIQRINPAFTKITGYTAEEAQGKPAGFLSSGRHDSAFYQKMWESIHSDGHWQGEIWNRRKNDDVYIAWLSISAITDENNRVVQYMAILSDISRLQEDIENARYLANYDSLTNLPNRAFFQDSLLQARNRAIRCKRSFGLLFIDLDGFKQINDTLGHSVGDQLLRSVADCLRRCVRETDVVARIGGDEFTIILNNLRFTADAGRVADKVVKMLEHPFEIENHIIEISASVGITVYPSDTHNNTVESVESLIKQADHAMYQAKNAGKGNFRFYHKPD
jgi:diguanylate cyclase (GGDEF)-like protein/PAS domain S-box-containing protein